MMPVGVLTDCSCVLIGGLLGTVLGSRFTPRPAGKTDDGAWFCFYGHRH